MGNEQTITAAQFPKQGEYLGRRCQVIFHYNGQVRLHGTIVRDDREKPWRTIIRLDDGRYVLSTECQYAPELPHG
jgi:hypothetical protein